jgi:hypothetical protein
MGAPSRNKLKRLFFRKEPESTARYPPACRPAGRLPTVGIFPHLLWSRTWQKQGRIQIITRAFFALSSGLILTFGTHCSGHLCECQNQKTTSNFKILVSRFRSLHHFRRLGCELRNRKNTSNPLILGWLWFGSPHDRAAAMMMRFPKPPHWWSLGFDIRFVRLCPGG